MNKISVMSILLGGLIGFSVTSLLIMLIIVYVGDSFVFPASLVLAVNGVFGPLAAGFGGALAGSWSSYVFQRNSAEKMELENEARAVGALIYSLSVMHQNLGNIRMVSVRPFESDPLRFFHITEFSSFLLVRPNISLDFLPVFVKLRAIEINKHLYECNHAYAVVEKFAIEAGRVRRQILDNAAQAGLAQLDMLDLRDFAGAVGEQNLYELYSVVEVLLDAIGNALKSTTGALSYVRDRCEPYFTGHVRMHYPAKSSLELPAIPPPHFSDLAMLKEAVRSPRG